MKNIRIDKLSCQYSVISKEKAKKIYYDDLHNEKPSVAQDLLHVMGVSFRHDGYFEGNGYHVT